MYGGSSESVDSLHKKLTDLALEFKSAAEKLSKKSRQVLKRTRDVILVSLGGRVESCVRFQNPNVSDLYLVRHDHIPVYRTLSFRMRCLSVLWWRRRSTLLS
eukprot:1364681-Amorphochlora_amoeboformis.AAC.2